MQPPGGEMGKHTTVGNPKEIVSSSPGLRVRELPWEIVRPTTQPQRRCGLAWQPRTQPRWDWLALMHPTQGCSFVATLGFVSESLWDSCNPPCKICAVMGFRGTRPNWFVVCGFLNAI